MRGLVAVCVLAACSHASQLVKSVPEPPGGNCANGGVAIESGTDDNGDGTLQAGEVDDTSYVCNGSSSGAALVNVVPEPAGANCGSGGNAISTGTDYNGNGALDDDEIQQTIYVCNGANGSSQLVTTQPEPAGLHCEAGGIAILVGTDTNRDGILSSDEVTSTSYVCNGAFAGDTITGGFMIANSLDVALLAGIKHVTGGLWLDRGSPLDDVTLPDLQTVGSLWLDSSSVRHISLPNLVSAAGGVSLGDSTGNTSGNEIELPNLQHVGGWLYISGMADPFALPTLATVGGDLSFRGRTSDVQTLSAPLLSMVGGTLWLVDLHSLVHADFSSLSSLSGIAIEYCENLAVTEFLIPPVHALPNQMALVSVPWTSLGPLASVSQSSQVFIISTAISNLDLPNLTSVGWLSILGDAIQSFAAPALTTVTGPVYVEAPQLPACQVTDVLDAIGYQGQRSIYAAPC